MFQLSFLLSSVVQSRRQATLQRDIKPWSGLNFQLIRCGINKDQVIDYGLPENPERPDQYQWEALTETAASEIVTKSIEAHWSLGAIKEVEEKQEILTKRWRNLLDGAAV